MFSTAFSHHHGGRAAQYANSHDQQLVSGSEVRPVNWKCSLSTTFNLHPCLRDDEGMMLEAHVLLIMNAEQTTEHSSWIAQKHPSQPATGMAHYTCNGPARAESVS